MSTAGEVTAARGAEDPKFGVTTMRRRLPSRMPRIAFSTATGTRRATSCTRTVSPWFLLSCGPLLWITPHFLRDADDQPAHADCMKSGIFAWSSVLTTALSELD